MSEDLISYVLNYSRDLGAKYVEGRYQLDKYFAIILRNGKLVTLGTSINDGVGIRLIYDGVLTFSATNKLCRDELVGVVRNAISRARAIAHLVKTPTRFSNDVVGRGSYEVTPTKDLNSLDVSEKVKLLIELYDVIVSSTKEVKIPATYCEYVEHIQEKLIVNSDGGFVRSRVPRLLIVLNLVLHHPQKGSIQRVMEFGASGGLELIDEWDLFRVVEEEVKNLERNLVEGVEPPKEPVDVVLGPEVVGIIVHESAGHPMEADRILGRESAQAGGSYVKPEYIGSYRIGSEYVTVIEDPTIPKSYGYYEYDDECIKARPRYLYKEGIIYEPLHNRQTAHIFRTISNGSSRAMDYASEPLIRMSNTYFKPGDMDFEELIEDIRLGVYIKSYMEWNIDDIRWNQRYVGLESYLIVNGELRGYIRNPVLELTTAGLYSKVVGVDKNLRFYPGTCGKGDPPQGVPVWFGGPNVRLSKIRLGVTV